MRELIWPHAPVWERPWKRPSTIIILNLTLPWSNLAAWEHFKRMAVYFQIQMYKACGIIPKNTAKGALAKGKSEYLGQFKN